MSQKIVSTELLQMSVCHLERFQRLTRIYAAALASQGDSFGKKIGIELSQLSNDIDVAREELSAAH